MQTYSFYEHKDILLSENEFYQKYHITSDILVLSYKINYDHLNNICRYYLSLKDKLHDWMDIPFPSYENIMNYAYGFNFFYCYDFTFEYAKKREAFYTSKKEHEVHKRLKGFGLTFREIQMLINKNKTMVGYLNSDFAKIIEMMKKCDISNEKLIYAILNKSYILNFTIREFDAIVKQVSEEKDCDYRDAILKYI